MDKKNKVLISFYIFLAGSIIISLVYIDSTFVCEDFYTIAQCQREGGPDPDTVELVFEPSSDKEWVRPTIQFANPKLNEVNFEAEYDIGKKVLFNIMNDVKNYPIILPGNVLSSVIIEEEPNVILAEETVMERGIKVTVLVKHTMIPYETHTVEVMNGDAKGTKIIQSFTGDESSTKLSTKIQLKLDGLLTPFYFLPKNNFEHAMNTVNTSFVDYSKGFDSESKRIIDDVYREILLRPADDAALEYWSPLIESGSITKTDLKNQLLDSDEGLQSALTLLSSRFTPNEIIEMMPDESIENIDKIYREILLRPADVEGLAHWGALLEYGLINEDEIRKEIYNSIEAIELRISSEASHTLKIEGDEFKVYKAFEDLVNETYFEVFNKYPDAIVKVHYSELLHFRVMATNDLQNEFSNGEQTCVYDETVEITWITPNDGVICTFFHPNPTVMPENWDKAEALKALTTKPP